MGRDNGLSTSTCKSGNALNIVYYNARSLIPKLDDLYLIAQSMCPDIICIVETWLCGDILDSEIALHGYLVHRADRNRHGGGVLINIKQWHRNRFIIEGAD